MTKKALFRFSAAAILLAVLLSQAGLAWLHTHQGMPDRQPVTVLSDAGSTTSCQVCALDAVMASEVVLNAFELPRFSTPDFAVLLSDGFLHADSGPSVGRAPPAC